ncbi:hypothetical protein F5880DRAFT_1491516, partial [Lentinula raphanica]
FATHSSRFADSYAHGLNGRWAAWANKKFRGHRVMPPEFHALLEAEMAAQTRVHVL